jgi:hypothetical protein
MRSRTPSRTTCLPHAVRRSQFFSPSSSEFRAGGAGGTEHAPVQAGPAPEGAADSLVDGVRLTHARLPSGGVLDAPALALRLAMVAVPPVTSDGFSAAGSNDAPREPRAQHFTQLRWLAGRLRRAGADTAQLRRARRARSALGR